MTKSNRGKQENIIKGLGWHKNNKHGRGNYKVHMGRGGRGRSLGPRGRRERMRAGSWEVGGFVRQDWQRTLGKFQGTGVTRGEEKTGGQGWGHWARVSDPLLHFFFLERVTGVVADCSDAMGGVASFTWVELEGESHFSPCLPRRLVGGSGPAEFEASGEAEPEEGGTESPRVTVVRMQSYEMVENGWETQARARPGSPQTWPCAQSPGVLANLFPPIWGAHIPDYDAS